MLRPDGRSAWRWSTRSPPPRTSQHAHGAFRVTDPYLEQRRYTDSMERDGQAMTFTSMHRPLSAYTSALFAEGMALTALTEAGEGIVPWLLALRAEKLPR